MEDEQMSDDELMQFYEVTTKFTKAVVEAKAAGVKAALDFIQQICSGFAEKNSM